MAGGILGLFVISLGLCHWESTSRGGTLMVSMMASVLEEAIWMVTASCKCGSVTLLAYYISNRVTVFTALLLRRDHQVQTKCNYSASLCSLDVVMESVMHELYVCISPRDPDGFINVSTSHS
jgi:hypothetical protein